MSEVYYTVRVKIPLGRWYLVGTFKTPAEAEAAKNRAIGRSQHSSSEIYESDEKGKRLEGVK